MELHFLVLAALCSCTAASSSSNESEYDANAENTWITADDQQIANWASEAVTTWCAGGWKGSNDAVNEAKAEAAENNIVVTIFEENITDLTVDANMERLQELAKEYLQGDGTLIVLPFVLSILSIVIWLFCCWSACCKCCRCCKKERPQNKACVAVQAVIVVVFFLALAVLGLGVKSSTGTVVNGIDNTFCAVSTLLNTSLQGAQGSDGIDAIIKRSEGFIGMMPVLDKFFYIEQQMKANSPLMNDIGDILDKTADIEKSVVLVYEEIKLFGEMLSAHENTYPAYGNNVSLDHTCQLCEKMGPLVTGIADGLDGGMGNALNKARSEVDSQLSYSNRKSLIDSVQSAAGPLKDAKKSMGDALKKFVDPDFLSPDQTDKFEQMLMLSFLGLLMLALLLVCCGCCSTACCATRYTHNDKPSTVAPRCATCVWCCAFLYIVLVFMLVGFVNAIVLPAGMICDFLTSVDGEMLQMIASSQGQDTTTDAFIIGKDLIDACWAGNKGANPNMLDLIYQTVDDNGTNKKKYLRQTLVTDTTKPIDDQFSKITDMMGTVNISLATSPAFVDLTNFINDASVKGLLLPSERVTQSGGDWDGDQTYGGLMHDTPVKVALVTQSKCSNYTFEGQTIPGIEFFVDILKALPGATPANSVLNTCIQKVDCSSVTTAGDLQEACESGNAFLDLKTKLVDGTAQFKCNVFKNADGTKCDPLNMRQLGNGSYVNDCLKRHESGLTFVEQFEESCTLDEFETYVTNFGQRLSLAIDRLDNVTNVTMDVIVQDLQNLVEKYFVNTLNEVADGITCGFFQKTRQELIDGLCYQSLSGFATINSIYGVTATLIILLGLDMYILFRIMIDNSNLAAAQKGDVEQQV